MLHLCPQYRFHISFSIGTYLLKLVNSYNTGFIRLFQISENLFQSSLCCMNIPKPISKTGSPVTLSNLNPARREEITEKKLSINLLPLGFNFSKISFPKANTNSRKLEVA